MEKAFLEKLKSLKKGYDISHICFFNDGKVMSDEYYSAKRIVDVDSMEEFRAISDVFYKATQSYARNYDFDRIAMDLSLGLIFAANDVEGKNHIKKGAQPVQGIVRYYTGSVNSYLGKKKTNTIDYVNYGVGRQSYIGYNQLLVLAENSGLVFDGPETFEEFKERVLSGEKFGITLTANLRQKEDENQFSK